MIAYLRATRDTPLTLGCTLSTRVTVSTDVAYQNRELMKSTTGMRIDLGKGVFATSSKGWIPPRHIQFVTLTWQLFFLLGHLVNPPSSLPLLRSHFATFRAELPPRISHFITDITWYSTLYCTVLFTDFNYGTVLCTALLRILDST
jgi:hypothetical protein